MFRDIQQTNKNFLIQNMSISNFTSDQKLISMHQTSASSPKIQIQKIHFSIHAARNQASAALSRRGAHFLPILEFCANSMRRFLLPALRQLPLSFPLQNVRAKTQNNLENVYLRALVSGGTVWGEEATTTRPSKPAASAEQARARRHLQNPLLLQCLSTTLCTIYR